MSRLLTIKETARILRVPTRRAYQLARHALLPVVHLGRQVRVDEHLLREWIRAGGKSWPGGWRREAPDDNDHR